MKKKYKYIYLTDSLGEVTWCQDQIEKDDVRYVNESEILGLFDEESIIDAILSYHKVKLYDLKGFEQMTIKAEAKAIMEYIKGKL